jgi:hypothetical protein
MKLSEIQSEWEVDSKIDNLNLDGESLKVSRYHAKYLNLLSNSKLQLRKAESDYLRLHRNKARYYKGEMSKEELEELEWTQYLGPKLLKSDVGNMIETDDEVIRVLDKIEYYKTVVFQLEQILKSLASRSFDIRNSIEWLKYTNGSL